MKKSAPDVSPLIAQKSVYAVAILSEHHANMLFVHQGAFDEDESKLAFTK